MSLHRAVQIGADEGMELGKAMLCLKGHRLYIEIWNDQPTAAGDMTNDRLGVELANWLPGAILLKNDIRELPCLEL